MALCTPVLFAIAGMVIVTSLGLYARFQMITSSHIAVTSCASETGTSITRVRDCVRGLAQTRALAAVAPYCQPILPDPEFIRVQQQPAATSEVNMYAVTQRISCSFRSGIGFLALLPGGPPGPFTISAVSTAPFIPGTT